MKDYIDDMPRAHEGDLHEGDYVIFAAREDENVCHGINEEMEEQLRGKIFRVSKIYGGEDTLEIEPCELTGEVEEHALDWTFSHEMFVKYFIESNEPLEFSFDNFLEVQHA